MWERELRIRVNLGELPTIMTKYDRYLFIQVHSFIISSRFIMLSIYTMCLLLLAARIQTRIGLCEILYSISHGICDKNRIIRAMIRKTMERVYESKTMSGGCLVDFIREASWWSEYTSSYILYILYKILFVLEIHDARLVRYSYGRHLNAAA